MSLFGKVLGKVLNPHRLIFGKKTSAKIEHVGGAIPIFGNISRAVNNVIDEKPKLKQSLVDDTTFVPKSKLQKPPAMSRSKIAPWWLFLAAAAIIIVPYLKKNL